MTANILLAGFGGQGILFSGKFLAYAGLNEGKQISWLPSYGPEMRGGTANCSVIISDEPVGSPIVNNPDILVDSSLIERKVARTDVEVFYIPATQLAKQMGAPTLANMIISGKLIKETGVIDYANVEAALKKVVSAKHADLLSVNLEAIAKGYEF